MANHPYHGSVIELSRPALRSNLRFLRRRIGKGVRFSSVIKGNAYGHGIEAFVPMAEACGVRHFCVFSAEEALRAKRSLTQKSEILIMGWIEDEAVEWAVENGVSFYVFDLQRLEAARHAASAVGVPAKVHLELETGMNRTGLSGEQLDEAVDLVGRSEGMLCAEGLCTHLAGAESVGNDHRIRRQLQAFDASAEDLRAKGIEPRERHAACSAAALLYPESIYDLVRIGIAQYGFWPSTEVRMRLVLEGREPGDRPRKDPLRRVLRWVSSVMSLKDLPRGEYAGYGTSYLATKKRRLAAVPVGYYHGFPRGLSNLGFVLVRGRRAPVVGVVNMNMMLVDVSEIPGVERGDEVAIIGKQGRSAITLASFGDLASRLNYEVLVRLPADLKRVITD